MNKKLAILFASLSLCACGFIGCGDSDKGVGDKCEVSDDCTAEEGLFCQKQAEGDEMLCAAPIADNGKCINKSDKCATSGAKCQEKGGDGSDKKDLICKKSEKAGDKAAMKDKCGDSADGKECDSAKNLKCVKEGEETDYTCKIESGKACEAATDVCEGGMVCKGDAGSMTCQADDGGKAGLNDKCVANAADATADAKVCDTNLECVGEGANAKCLKSNGQECSAAAECASGNCPDATTKVCAPAAAAGKEYNQECDDATTAAAADKCKADLVCELKDLSQPASDSNKKICKHEKEKACASGELCAKDGNDTYSCKEDASSQENPKPFKCQKDEATIVGTAGFDASCSLTPATAAEKCADGLTCEGTTPKCRINAEASCVDHKDGCVEAAFCQKQADGTAYLCKAKIADGAECVNADDVCATATKVCRHESSSTEHMAAAIKCFDKLKDVKADCTADAECDFEAKLVCDGDSAKKCLGDAGAACTQNSTDECKSGLSCLQDAGSNPATYSCQQASQG